MPARQTGPLWGRVAPGCKRSRGSDRCGLPSSAPASHCAAYCPLPTSSTPANALSSRQKVAIRTPPHRARHLITPPCPCAAAPGAQSQAVFVRLAPPSRVFSRGSATAACMRPRSSRGRRSPRLVRVAPWRRPRTASTTTAAPSALRRPSARARTARGRLLAGAARAHYSPPSPPRPRRRFLSASNPAPTWEVFLYAVLVVNFVLRNATAPANAADEAAFAQSIDEAITGLVDYLHAAIGVRAARNRQDGALKLDDVVQVRAAARRCKGGCALGGALPPCPHPSPLPPPPPHLPPSSPSHLPHLHAPSVPCTSVWVSAASPSHATCVFASCISSTCGAV